MDVINEITETINYCKFQTYYTNRSLTDIKLALILQPVNLASSKLTRHNEKACTSSLKVTIIFILVAVAVLDAIVSGLKK